MSITLTRSPVYRELQKSGRKSAGAKSKAPASTSVADPVGSMGPPQTIPKKGKGLATVVPMSEDEDGNTQGQSAAADMDIDAEMNDVEEGEDADAVESQGEEEGDEDEDEGEEGDEEEPEELVDQMTVEDEELRQDTKGLDLQNPRADVEDV